MITYEASAILLIFRFLIEFKTILVVLMSSKNVEVDFLNLR